jgi:WD40 repeat protein
MAGSTVRKTLQGHSGAVGCLAFALQGRRLVSGSSDCSVIVWDLETGKGEVVGKSGQPVNGIAVSPDGKMLAWPYMRESAVSLILGTQVCLIDVSTKRSLGSLHELFGADRLAFSPVGKVLATSSVGSKVNLWNVSDRKLQVLFTPNATSRDERNVMAVRFSPSGTTLVTVDYRGDVRFWTPNDGKEQARLIPHRGRVVSDVAFSPDGKILAIASGPEKIVRFWDVEEALKARDNGN